MYKKIQDNLFSVVCIVVIVIMLFFIGRGSDREVYSKATDKVPRTIKSSDNQELSIIKIGNCEYIRSEVYAGYSYTHKGDCNNPIHVYQYGK